MTVKSVKNKTRGLYVCGVTLTAAITALTMWGCVDSTLPEQEGYDNNLILPSGEAWVRTYGAGPSTDRCSYDEDGYLYPTNRGSKDCYYDSEKGIYVEGSIVESRPVTTPNFAYIFKADGSVERHTFNSRDSLWHVLYLAQISWSTLGNELTLYYKDDDTSFAYKFALTGAGAEQILTLQRISDEFGEAIMPSGYERRTISIKPPPNVTTFTDSRDNNKKYKKVTIGAQTWMAENLNYDVPNDTTDACYANSADSCAKYGRLYDWETAMTACPTGWHLPSGAEWDTLLNTVGGASTAGVELKTSSGWGSSSSYSGDDYYGFSALPGGNGNSNGSFRNVGSYGYWWTATESGASNAWNRYMYYYDGGVRREDAGKGYRFSVRCVENPGTYTITFNPTGGTVSPTSGTTGVYRTLASLPVPTRGDGYAFVGWFTAAEGGTAVTINTAFGANSTIYARWYVSKGNNISNYKTVTIGTQNWMAENLDYDVPSSTSDVCYENSADSCAKYGRLYDWNTAQLACPAGWRLPTDAEWTTLTDFAGGTSTAGTKLKSSQYWQSYYYAPTGTDDFGFSALPGGYSWNGGDNFSGAGNYGYWWTATDNGTDNASFREMYYSSQQVMGIYFYPKTNLYSVRCVQ